MKAAVIHAPRDLRIEDADVPALGPHDVRVRVRAGGICGSDLHYYQHGGFGTVLIREPFRQLDDVLEHAHGEPLRVRQPRNRQPSRDM